MRKNQVLSAEHDGFSPMKTGILNKMSDAKKQKKLQRGGSRKNGNTTKNGRKVAYLSKN
ncbi:MAG: hypothetical protein PUD98_05835 [Bacteroidales bacterium]|nr:hypothetical protein [Bacteroidales bacterium]